MRSQKRTKATLATLLAAGALALGPVAAANQRTRPEITTLGKTSVKYEDDSIKVALSFRDASANLDYPWLLLDTRWSTTDKANVEIAREDITLVMPDGKRLPLPSMKRVLAAHQDVDRLRRRASVSREPLSGYFTSRNRSEPVRFFTVPVVDQFYAGSTRMSYGDLLFAAPGGAFPEGRYVLEIQNKDLDVRIPFTLPAGSRVASGATDRGAVSW